MARFKDANWNFRQGPNGNIESWEQAQTAVLMDIRDELKRLNQLLHCQNFIGIPSTLKRMDRRIAAHAPLKEKK